MEFDFLHAAIDDSSIKTGGFKRKYIDAYFESVLQ